MNQTKAERKTHIDKANNLSIYRQCALVEVSRSSFYDKALSETELNLKLMRLIDEEYMRHLSMVRCTWYDERVTQRHEYTGQ